MKLKIAVALSIFLLCTSVHAAPQGKIFGEHGGKSAVYDIQHHRLATLPHPHKDVSNASTAKVRWIDDSTDTQIRIKNVRTGAYKILFDSKRPDALYNALKRSKSKELRDLYQDVSDDDPGAKQWAISDAELTNNGRYAYFMTNAGGEESQNYEFCCVRVDIVTGELSLLNQGFWGQWPNIFALSPDSRQLLIGLPDHNSAADDSYAISIIDLNSGKSIDILKPDPKGKTSINDVTGACWSPDSQYVAVSIAYYTTDQISDSFKPVYNLEIKSASTGRTLETAHDFSSPYWQR